MTLSPMSKQRITLSFSPPFIACMVESQILAGSSKFSLFSIRRNKYSLSSSSANLKA
jgi:hypothetical protein